MTHLPTIHLNGTSPETLFDEYNAVRISLIKTVSALEDATCNARDFYVQGDGAWEKARNERTAMFAKLREVQDYVDAWIGCASDRLLNS